MRCFAFTCAICVGVGCTDGNPRPLAEGLADAIDAHCAGYVSDLRLAAQLHAETGRFPPSHGLAHGSVRELVSHAMWCSIRRGERAIAMTRDFAVAADQLVGVLGAGGDRSAVAPLLARMIEIFDRINAEPLR
jgi:hypothetical protein